VITDKGKEALNDWLKQQYNLPEDIYGCVEIDRTRQALEKLRAEVKTRMKPILP
jgi:DNA-binding PadR family transcriptional regulator